jgi:single-strand DNA-binding protein
VVVLVRAIHTTKEAPVATSNINRVVLTGNLTADPELRWLPSGTSVCRLRVAVNTRRKDSATGEYVDKPNYFDVVVWGAQGEACARYLAKGRPAAIDGHLEWREWQVDGGAKRQAVEVIADVVQFLGPHRRDEDAAGQAAAVAVAGEAS